jgi:hypothetical protein
MYLQLHNVIYMHLSNLIRILPVVLSLKYVDGQTWKDPDGRTEEETSPFLHALCKNALTPVSDTVGTVIINQTMNAGLHRRHNAV